MGQMKHSKFSLAEKSSFPCFLWILKFGFETTEPPCRFAKTSSFQQKNYPAELFLLNERILTKNFIISSDQRSKMTVQNPGKIFF
jgi:hypothetical protein